MRRLPLRPALLVERDEIDGIEQQRREPAVTYGSRDDLAGKRKQQPRALDHDQRLQRFLRDVLDAEYTRKRQIEREQHVPLFSALPSRVSVTS